MARNSVSVALKAKRTELNVSQVDMADLLKIKFAMYQKLESGNYKLKDPGVIRRYMDKLSSLNGTINEDGRVKQLEMEVERLNALLQQTIETNKQQAMTINKLLK